MAPFCDVTTDQAYHGPVLGLRLIAAGLAGHVLAAVHVPPSMTWSELVSVLSTLVGMPRELLQVFGAASLTVPHGSLPLAHSGLNHEDRITCLRLSIPLHWDTVAVCDQCRYYRHLFYGYAQLYPNAGWEPVLAFCYACGGRPEYRHTSLDILEF